MAAMDVDTLLLLVGLAVVAFLYGSVGHGGATGYLAVMSLLGFPPVQMASTALILNIMVAGLSFLMYMRAGHFRGNVTWPFLLTSIPMAFVGGLLPLKPDMYHLILAVALLVAAWRLALMPEASAGYSRGRIPLLPAMGVGAAIGLVSGMIGIGGGIFLSPVMVLLGWADFKTTSATSALFIVVNAAAGLTGRLAAGTLTVGPLLPFLMVAGLAGLLGARLGAVHWSGKMLKQMLGVVLLIAAAKLVLQVVQAG